MLVSNQGKILLLSLSSLLLLLTLQFLLFLFCLYFVVQRLATGSYFKTSQVTYTSIAQMLNTASNAGSGAVVATYADASCTMQSSVLSNNGLPIGVIFVADNQCVTDLVTGLSFKSACTSRTSFAGTISYYRYVSERNLHCNVTLTLTSCMVLFIDLFVLSIHISDGACKTLATSTPFGTQSFACNINVAISFNPLYFTLAGVYAGGYCQAAGHPVGQSSGNSITQVRVDTFLPAFVVLINTNT